MKTTVAKDWQEYRSMMLPKQLDAMEEKRLHQAFIAGGICIFERVVSPEIKECMYIDAELRAQLDLTK